MHDVDYSAFCVSVQVPHPKSGELAWVNIWSSSQGKGVHYAFLVPDEEFALWFRRGLRHEFQDSADEEKPSALARIIGFMTMKAMMVHLKDHGMDIF